MDFIKGIWSRHPLTWIGLILGAMSVLAIVQNALNAGFGPTLTLLLGYYENLIHALIGWWLEPFVGTWVEAVSAYLGWSLQLHSHWKHVLVLMTIYFSGDWRTLLAFQQPIRAALFGLWGVIVALLTSVAAGTVASAAQGYTANLWIACAPVCGYLIYALGGSGLLILWRPDLLGQRGRVYGRWAAEAVFRFALGIVIAAVGLTLPIVAQQRSPGLVMLALLVVILALYWVVIGLLHAIGSRGADEGVADAFRRQGNARVGAAILGSFISAALLVLGNAGLRFYGL